MKTAEEEGRGGGSGRRNCTRRKHLVDGEKNGRNKGRGMYWIKRERKRERKGGRKRPLRYPEWHRFFSAAEGAKNDFREGSKKTKILLGC